jgi:hypothetical protein
MGDAERIWREKSDEDLIEAAAELDQFTEEGRQIIRAELRRRGMEDPVEQAGIGDGPAAAEDVLPDPVCLRCHVSLHYIDTDDAAARGRWRFFGQLSPLVSPGGLLRAYVCPSCGHIDLFTDLPVDEEPEEEEQE